MNKILAITLGLFLCVGCQKKEAAKDTKIAQVPSSDVVVVWPDGKKTATKTEHITPAYTEYQGQGVSYERWVYGNRNVSPFGVSPAELMARQQPDQIATGTTPTININPNGVNVGTSTEGAFKGGSGNYSWFDGIVTSVKDWGFGAILFVGIGLILLLVLPVIFPMLAPVLQKIWDGITWFFTTIIFPWIGAIGNWIQVNILTKAATQIVAGGDAFQQAIKDDTQLPQNVKDYVLDLYNKSHLMANDEKTNLLVKKLRLKSV